MNISPMTFVIVLPLVFLAGFVDAIGGGGGLISLPAYLIAGLPVHQAIATNKLSACCGTALATARFIKNKLVNFKLAAPSIVAAMIGSWSGARLALMVSDDVILKFMFVVLPLAAFIVMNKKIFHDNPDGEIVLTGKLYVICAICSLIIGIYDGFYGPGTGTFLIICFTIFGKMSMKKANGQCKVINLTTNVTSLAVYLASGNVLLLLGIAAAVCNMIGGWLGAGLVMSQGSKIVKPTILLVLFLLLLKVLGVY